MKKVLSILILLISFSFSSYSQCEEMIIAPNAFTPNDDGLNDIWIPVVNLRQNFEYSLIISNKNEKIFESTDIKKGWNGIGADVNGDFYYRITVKYRWTPISETETCEKVGTIILIK